MKKVLFIQPAKTFEGDSLEQKLKFTTRREEAIRTSRAFLSLPAMTILGSLKDEYHTYFLDMSAEKTEQHYPIAGKLKGIGLDDKELLDRVNDIKPDAVLVTSMFSSEQITVDRLCKTLKERYSKSLPIIVGGHHATLKPDWILENGNVDAVALGEAELTISDILKSVLEKEDLSKVRGVAFCTPSGIHIIQNPKRLEDLTLPWEIDKVVKNGRSYRYNQGLVTRCNLYIDGNLERAVGTLYNSRGCPFACTYCSATKRDGSKIRHMGVDRAKEIFDEFYKKHGVKIFHNSSDTFGFTPQDREFLEWIGQLRKEDPEITMANQNAFFTRYFFTGQNLELDRDRIDLLERAGFKVITLAVETFAQRFNKKIPFDKITPEKIKELLQELKRRNIGSDIYMVYGYPTQTEEEVLRDIKTIDSFNEDYSNVTWRSLTYFPGTEYYDWAIAKGKFTEDEYRRKILQGHTFYQPTDVLNFSEVPTKKLRELFMS